MVVLSLNLVRRDIQTRTTDKMRILLANSIDTFRDDGGQAVFRDRVRRSLVASGHHVDCITLPFVRDPQKLAEQLLAYRMLDLSSSTERLITFDTPACFLSHPNKWIVITSAYRALSASLPIGFSQVRYEGIDRKLVRAQQVAFSEAEAILFDTIRSSQLVRSMLAQRQANSYCLDILSDDEIASILTMTNGLPPSQIRTNLDVRHSA